MTSLLLFLLWAIPQEPVAVDLDSLRVGHWVEVRGRLVDDLFVAERAELQQPQRYELLIGEVEVGSIEGDRFVVLGQPVHVSERTEWEEGLRLRRLEGRRVEIEGRWRDLGKLSAREISSRGPGRERIAGPIDALRRVSGGLEAEVLRYRVLFPTGFALECEQDPGGLERSAPRPVVVQDAALEDDDDRFGEGILLGPVRIEGQVEGRSTSEWDFDLDAEDAEDRVDRRLSARLRASWRLTDRVSATLEGKFSQRWREDDEDGSSSTYDSDLGEAFVSWSEPLGYEDLELRIGRQDFDDAREWIYDQDLDAVLLAWQGAALSLELSTSTTLADGEERDEESTNWMAYLSNGDRKRHLAAWAAYRRFDLSSEERSLHVGARAIGEWLEDVDLWGDFALQRGERLESIDAFGYDVGLTWTPDLLEPFSFTLGYALGSGGRNGGDRDGTFRQTGFQDNNGRFAGVTSFRYYGELMDPELANLGIWTAGIGLRPSERTSIDLVFHDYLQDRAAPFLVDADIDGRPDGIDPDLGREIDLILGWREWANWDLEVVGAWFDPGGAFDPDEDAYLLKLQLRYRF